MKKIFFFLLLFLFASLLLKSQASRPVCADTAFDNSYFSNNFIISGNQGLITLSDNSKLITTVGSSSGDGYYGLAKISLNGTPQWHKLFNCSIPGLSLIINKTLELASGDIIIAGSLHDPTESIIPTYVFIKINTTGNIVWQHSYQSHYENILQPTLLTIKVVSLMETESGGFVALFEDDGYYGNNNLTCFAADGTVRWSRLYYGYLFLPNMHNAFNSGKLYLMGGTRMGCTNINVAAQSFLSTITINTTDGSIADVKSLCETPADRLSNLGLGYSTMSKKIDNGNIVTVTSNLYNLLCIVIDSNSNFVRSAFYSMPLIQSPGPGSGQSAEYAFDIQNNGSVAFSFAINLGFPINGSLPYLPLILLDSNLKIVTEYRFSVPTVAGSSASTPIYFSPNGNINFFSAYASYPPGSPGFALVSMPPHTKGAALCYGNDTLFGSFRYNYTLTTQTQTLLPDSIKENIYNILSCTPAISTQDVPLSKILTCNNVSICDSFKLYGSSHFCLSNDTILFTAFKNSLCRKNIIWDIDSSFAAIVDKPGDSSIHLQFLKAGTVSLHGSLDGCVLKDSIKITITQPKQELIIQKEDSLLCPGKILILQATKGFAQYRWPDGSGEDHYTITDTGFYKVIAVDSCGNTFKDSITVTFADTAFNVPAAVKICNTDTFKVQVPLYLTPINLQPAFGATYANHQVLLYPVHTTAYTIIAETNNKCKTEKNILINVDNCAANIFFPNAFSPNGNSSNIFFKPFVTLPLQHYQLLIYNRFGQKVFESNSVSIGWNGKYGEVAQAPAAYIYYCSYKFFNKPAATQKGYCILLR
jgi:gliding motility-associated-like protein